MKPTETNKEIEMERMGKDERETAENLVVKCMKVADKLKEIHDMAEELLNKYGWDLEVWEVAEAGMQVGILGLGIAHSIGCEDGWADMEDVK